MFNSTANFKLITIKNIRYIVLSIYIQEQFPYPLYFTHFRNLSAKFP